MRSFSRPVLTLGRNTRKVEPAPGSLSTVRSLEGLHDAKDYGKAHAGTLTDFPCGKEGLKDPPLLQSPCRFRYP